MKKFEQAPARNRHCSLSLVNSPLPISINFKIWLPIWQVFKKHPRNLYTSTCIHNKSIWIVPALGSRCPVHVEKGLFYKKINEDFEIQNELGNASIY